MDSGAVEEDDRVITSVEPIASYIFESHDVFDQNGTVKVTELREHLRREGRLHKEPLLTLCRRASEIMREEPNLLKLDQTITSKHNTIPILGTNGKKCFF